MYNNNAKIYNDNTKMYNSNDIIYQIVSIPSNDNNGERWQPPVKWQKMTMFSVERIMPSSFMLYNVSQCSEGEYMVGSTYVQRMI